MTNLWSDQVPNLRCGCRCGTLLPREQRQTAVADAEPNCQEKKAKLYLLQFHSVFRPKYIQCDTFHSKVFSEDTLNMAGTGVYWMVSVLLMLSGISCLKLDSFLLAAMDDTMLTMESERASLDFTKKIVVSEHAKKPVMTYKKTSRKWGMRGLYISCFSLDCWHNCKCFA